ncbi:MAG TPA: DUF1801 domain-containing protein [Spirillospora sp.]|nr:DUF1801 domain-containing protein [Spirillospora sp.]
MAQNKTQETEKSVQAFLESIEDDQKREDSFTLLKLMQEVTGEEPRIWGDSIIGFGKYHYKYASGREGDAMLAGFSPRKQNLAVYIMAGFDDYESLLNKLGKHKRGKSCLYINRLRDVDSATLKELIHRSVEHMRATHPPA